MQTIKNFSGEVSKPATKGFNFSLVSDGKIYKAVQGTDYVSSKGFIVALSRYANSNGFKADRYVATDGTSVEFRFTTVPVTLEV